MSALRDLFAESCNPFSGCCFVVDLDSAPPIWPKGCGFVSHPLDFRYHQFRIYGLLIIVKLRYRLSMSTRSRFVFF
ncbi:hypothetical protein Hanom_Chr01g00034021 [Helianthus anomalus]